MKEKIDLIKQKFELYKAAVKKESDYGDSLDLGSLFVFTKVKTKETCWCVTIPEVHVDSHKSIYAPAQVLAEAIMGAGESLYVGVEEPTKTNAGALIPNVAAGKDRPKVIAGTDKLFATEPAAQASVAYQLYVKQVENAGSGKRFVAEPDSSSALKRNDAKINPAMATELDNQWGANRLIVYPVGKYHLGTAHSEDNKSLLLFLAKKEWDLEN